MAGLTDAGLTIKRLADIREDLEDAIQSPDGLGPGADVGPDGPLGKLIGIVATQLSLPWAALKQLQDASDPDNAGGEQLENIAAYTGTIRLDETRTTGDITLTGTAGTDIPQGSQVRQGSTGPIFRTTEDVTIGGGGSVTVEVEAVETGPISATAGSIDTIVTVIAGWTGITHGSDLTLGRSVEEDSELRVRREDSVQSPGRNTDGSIRAAVAAIDEVEHVGVRSNRTGATVDGIPKHKFEVVVYPNTVDVSDIVEAIWLNIPSGIGPYGSTSGTVVDTEDYSHTIPFTFASEIDVYIDVTVTTSSSAYPSDGDDQIEDAIVEMFDALEVGDDVLIADLICAAKSVTGVLTIEALAKVGSAPGPSDNVTIPITFREIAVVDPANITVTST